MYIENQWTGRCKETENGAASGIGRRNASCPFGARK